MGYGGYRRVHVEEERDCDGDWKKREKNPRILAAFSSHNNNNIHSDYYYRFKDQFRSSSSQRIRRLSIKRKFKGD